MTEACTCKGGCGRHRPNVRRGPPRRPTAYEVLEEQAAALCEEPSRPMNRHERRAHAARQRTRS